MATEPTTTSIRHIAITTGMLVEKKDAAYGNSFDVAGDFLKTLYPDGVKPHQYGDMLALVRIYDKMKRIASGDSSENSWQDITGYGILGQRSVLRKSAKYEQAMKILENKIEKLKTETESPDLNRDEPAEEIRNVIDAFDIANLRAPELT